MRRWTRTRDNPIAGRLVRRAPRLRAGRGLPLLGRGIRGWAAADLGGRRSDDAGPVRGVRGPPDGPQVTGVAFSIDGDAFLAFARSLPGALPTAEGRPLQPEDIVDFDLCWAYEFTDPWGNRFELNTYDYDRVRVELIEGDGVTPVRYWPAELLDEWRG